jgi:hypothetical protein
MIDTLGLAISHSLILLAAWRLFLRPDLDNENPEETGFRPKGRNRA